MTEEEARAAQEVTPDEAILCELRNLRQAVVLAVHHYEAMRARLQRLERRPWMARRMR